MISSTKHDYPIEIRNGSIVRLKSKEWFDWYMSLGDAERHLEDRYVIYPDLVERMRIWFGALVTVDYYADDLKSFNIEEEAAAIKYSFGLNCIESVEKY